MDYHSMDFLLTVTNYVGTANTLVNGLFVILIIIVPPDNLGMFRSQYYVGAFAGFWFAVTQLWNAVLLLPNGTLFVVFSARGVGPIGYLMGLAALNLQFTMLSSNFAVRYAAIRGGWIRYYLTNQYLFYTVQTTCVLGAYIPPIIMLSSTPEIRSIVQTTYGETINFDFMNEFYFVSTYEHLILGNLLFHQSIFLMAIGFQGTNLLIMLGCGLITYVHISRNTQSPKLRSVNNRLLRARTFQAIFSFIFLFMPGLVVNSSMMLRVDVSSIAPYLCSLMSFGTIFNPFVDITLTPGYRKKSAKTLCKIFKVKNARNAGELTVSTVHITVKTSPTISDTLTAYCSMEFYLTATTYVGSFSTLVNGLFVILILVSPPDNLGMFRSQYYFGAITSFAFAATQTWAACLLIPNGTLFVVFSARGVDPISFLSCLATLNLQFTMLSSNFAVRYAAVRGGWIRYYLTNQILFYSVQATCVLGAYIPPIYLLYPTSQLRAITNVTHGETFKLDFMKEFFFVCSYDFPTFGNILAHHIIFIMAGGFEGINLLLMVVFGLITYVHISKNTTSAKLREVNNRLLRARILQGTFAFVFLFMPGLLINTSMLCKIFNDKKTHTNLSKVRVDASNIAPYLCSMTAFGTLFNPFVDIAQTPGYRRRIFRTLLGWNGVRSAGEMTISTVNTQFNRHPKPATVIHVK